MNCNHCGVENNESDALCHFCQLPLRSNKRLELICALANLTDAAEIIRAQMPALEAVGYDNTLLRIYAAYIDDWVALRSEMENV